MIRYFITRSASKKLTEIEKPQEGCWIHLEDPAPEEIEQVASLTHIPENFIKSALDEEEVAHVDSEKKSELVVVDIPKMIENDVFTMPLALIHNDCYLVSVCIRPTTVLNDFFDGKVKKIDTAHKKKLIYQIMHNNSVRFLYYLRQIDKASDRIQKSLSKSMQNKELLQLLELQKSLVFFSASLTANFSVIQKISSKSTKESEEERDILEDVIIESKQALEMCSVYREIIKANMDAFASVVNNNQNTVMKFLTAVTIVLSIPMVISGFWGMNTGVPWHGQGWGFWAAIGVSVFLSGIVSIFMIRKKMF